MQARFCFLRDESRTEGDPLFLPAVDYWAPSPFVYKLIAPWRPEPDAIGRVAGAVLLDRRLSRQKCRHINSRYDTLQKRRN